MRNLILHQTHIQTLFLKEHSFPISWHLDEFSKLLIVLDSELKILMYSYESSDVFSNFKLIKAIDLEELLVSDSNSMEILNEIMTECEGDIDVKNSKIKFFLYKNEEESLHIILESGVYITIQTNSEKIKISDLKDFMYERVDYLLKILSAEISPNLENIVLIFSNCKLLLLNYDFEFINCCDLDDGDNSDFSLDEFRCKSASVSWRGDSQFFSTLYEINGGRKCLVRDTKLNVFKGPARADNKVVFSTAEGPVKNLSDVISWQPSGSLIAYFQQNTTMQSTNSSSNLAGVLFSEKNCLRHGELWIDLAQLNIEDIQSKKISAKFLKWNMDLPLILVYLEIYSLNEKSEIDFNSVINVVNVYYRSNYEWALKYSFTLDKGEKLFACKFSDALSHRLYIFYTNSKFHSLEFKFEYQNSLTNNNFNEEIGSVAEINGNTIKLSPLGVVNIPPPMCLASIHLPKRIPPFVLTWWKNYLFALSQNRIDIIEQKNRNYTLTNFLEFDLDHFRTRLVKSFIFISSINDERSLAHFIIHSGILDEDSHDQILVLTYELEYEDGALKFKKLISKHSQKIHRCSGIFNSMMSENLYDQDYFKDRENVLELEDKIDVLSKKKNQNKNEDPDDLFFGLSSSDKNKDSKNSSRNKYFWLVNNNCKEKIFEKVYLNVVESDDIIDVDISPEETNVISQFEIIKARSVITFNNEEKIVYLTKNHRLYLDNKLLAIDVTSFEFSQHFLLFTQSSNSPYNSLHLLELNKKDFLNQFIIAAGNNEALFTQNFNYKGFNIRTIERGAMIVTISKVNLVLQMPRGNLETIYPRLLVLNLITDLVTIHRQFGQAFEIARKHKINPNFLYDVDPEGFFKNIQLYLKQTDNPDYINLFLNSMDNVFSEEMLHLNPDMNTKEDFKKLFINNKVNKICESSRENLRTMNAGNKYITSIIHTHIKKNPPEYLEALKLVQGLKIEEKNKLKIEEVVNTSNINNSAKLKNVKHDHYSADKTLEYLCWVVNADILFDFALKTYDFELVIMVAKHTQKDPKEYLPYLKKLQDLQDNDPILMKYQINIDLKFYGDALTELSKGGEKYFDKCVELINKHNLHEQAVTLFSKSEEKIYRAIYEQYGSYLKDVKKDILEAGWAYLKANKFAVSLKCFIEAGCVNEAINVLYKLDNFENTNFNAILIELIEACSARKKFSELEKIQLYLTQIQSKKSNEENALSNNLNVRQLNYKMMDAFITAKRWKMSYLFYESLKSQGDNDNMHLELNKIFAEGISLNATLHLNELKKNTSTFEEKYNRLLKVQHLKRTQPHLFNVEFKEKLLDDNVSDSGSVLSSKSGRSSKSSRSKISSTSKMSKKSKQKLSKRNIKEGSPIEEEYLIMVLAELKLDDAYLESIKDLVKVLNYVNLNEKSNELQLALDAYLINVNNVCSGLLSVAQQDYINNHPEIKELFPSLNLNQQTSKVIGFNTLTG